MQECMLRVLNSASSLATRVCCNIGGDGIFSSEENQQITIPWHDCCCCCNGRHAPARPSLPAQARPPKPSQQPRMAAAQAALAAAASDSDETTREINAKILLLIFSSKWSPSALARRCWGNRAGLVFMCPVCISMCVRTVQYSTLLSVITHPLHHVVCPSHFEPWRAIFFILVIWSN